MTIQKANIAVAIGGLTLILAALFGNLIIKLAARVTASLMVAQ